MVRWLFKKENPSNLSIKTSSTFFKHPFFPHLHLISMTSVISSLSKASFNHGCTDLDMDPKLETTQHYDFKYIERTVYKLAERDDSLGHSVKVALQVIEQAYTEYG